MSEARQGDLSPIHGSGWNVAAASIEPLYNLYVAASEMVLTIDMPYVDAKQIKFQCPSNDVVEILAETIRKITFKDLGVKHRHGEFTCYHARIRLPVPADEGRITSKFKRGMLEVRIPRKK